MNRQQAIWARHALLPTGWSENVRISIDAVGVITDVQSSSLPDAHEERCEIVLPGIPNAHSHAFQRGMAGLSEYRAGANVDTFWSWRETMYQFVDRLQPDDVACIARHLYIELLRHGYTSVCEFHYLHHDPDGHPYACQTELANRLLEAAQQVGMRIVLLPVLYTYGGFDQRALVGAQRRFHTDAGSIVSMIAALEARCQEMALATVGFAAHSLRAVTTAQLRDVLSQLHRKSPNIPVHLHLAEQQAEVDSCVERHGCRPLEHLAAEYALNRNWSLVHATHLSEVEIRILAGSDATAVLCPTTEANLGDGIFAMPAYLAHGGRFAIGSDSHMCVSPWEELRSLEYSQRLRHQQRNVVCRDHGSTGMTLVHEAVLGGSRAAGAPVAGIAPGGWADFICVEPAHPMLAGRHGDRLIDTLVFCGDAECIRDVYVAGNRVVTAGKHRQQDEASALYRECVSSHSEHHGQ